jgi:DNA-binding CsgD family transcriptional regulator/transposase-like protein
MSRQQTDIQESYARLLELQKQETSARKRDRLEMLKLQHDNPERSLADISREIGCAERSVLRWWQNYRAGGLDALLESKHRGRPSQLGNVDLDEVRTKLAESGMSGLEEIRAWLSEEYGLQYSRSGVWYILREILGARRNSGWLLIDSAEKPADSGENGAIALDNPAAVVGLLNSLPMTDDVVEWGSGFRAVLHRLLADVDRISVNVNRSCDMRTPEKSIASTRINRAVNESSDQDRSSIWVDKNRDGEAPYVRVLEGFRAKGLPLDQFHPPVVQDFFYGGKAYLGTIFLWRSLSAAPIAAETIERFKQLEPFFVYCFSDVVTRHQVLQPISGVFYEAAQQMFVDADLSPAERRIITLALLGHPYKEIADIMTVTLDAVKKHFHGIYKKTATRGQAELFAKYFTAQFRREQASIDAVED